MKESHRQRSGRPPLRARTGLLLLTVAVLISSASEARMRIIETDTGYLIEDAGHPVMFYQTAPRSTAEGTYTRANYCHPLYGLDGNVLTEDFPADHLHHRGLFWAWHQVVIGETCIQDMWDCTDFIWDVRTVTTLETPDTVAALQARVQWKSPQWKNADEPFAEETVTIRVHAETEAVRLIDFRIEILALEEGLRIGGSEDIKGYGGFSARIIQPTDLVMQGPSGTVTPEDAAVTAGEWVDFQGRFGDVPSGFAIFQHPGNPGRPRKWILRRSGSMQNAVYPGPAAVPVPTDSPLTLQYRLVIHRQADLHGLFDAYVAEVTQ